ncbi:hypothetical protein V5799_027051 [Amblyomma americanum]|uniref:Peptidase M13 N-terminal domain-containing protein n=1 Tax=Amblyomma americanum TaxID=6943 RepID=A0AAQ4DGU3_AMBAM
MMRSVADRNLHTAVPAHGQSAAQKAAQFYQSCLQIHSTGGEQEQREVKRLVATFGIHWPRLSNASNLLHICFAISNVLGWAPVMLFSMTRPGHILVTPASFYYTVLATRRSMLRTGSGDREYKRYFRLMLSAFSQRNQSSAVLPYGDLLALEAEVVPGLQQAYTLDPVGFVENATLDDIVSLAGDAIPRSRWEDELRKLLKAADLDDSTEYSFTIDNVYFFEAFFKLCLKLGEPRMAYYVGWVAVQGWSLLTKPDMIRFYYPSYSEAADGHVLLCAVLAQEYMGLAFYANYIREQLSAEDVGDVNALVRSVHESFRNGFRASMAWKDFTAKSMLSLEKNTSSPSAAPLSFVSDAQEKPVDTLFYFFPDMSSNLLENAKGAAAARRATPADTRMVNYRSNSTVRFYYVTREERFELLPVALEPPFYSVQAPPAVKYGTLGAEIGDATAAVIFQKLRGADADTRDRVGSEALCVLNAQNPVAKALPASPHWSHISRWQLAERAMSLDAVLRAFLRATGGEQPRLDGFESLKGEQILFIFWCMAQCGVADGKHKCNDPLKLFSFFARAFECKAGSTMSTITECI